MEWAKKRKIMYASGFALFIILLAIYPTYKITHPAPTCFDNRQNGNETGVDCGGSCALVCTADAKPLRVVWAKAFSLGGPSYDLGAYIENPNPKAGIKNARYNFRVFDSAGNVIAEKQGATEIAPGAGLVLFEPHISISGVPDRTEVVFNPDDISRWIRSKVDPSIITTKNQNLKNVDTSPRFDATLVNTDLVYPVSNLTLNAIVYDALRHPIAVSRTFVDSIPPDGTQDIFFTWPNRFSKHTGGGICTTPVDTVLVLDRSGSMNTGRKLVSAKNAANIYIDTAEQVDKIGLISFATTVSNPIDHGLSLSRDEIKSSLNAVEVEKGSLQYTDFGEALRAAVIELQGDRHTKGAKSIIVALTDGIANRPEDPQNPKNKAYPEKYAIQVAEAARSAGIEVYTIGLGKDINTKFLRDRIATDASHYFMAPTAAYLEDAYKKISQTVCKEEGFITDVVVTQQATFAQ